MGLPSRGVQYVLTLILAVAAVFFGSWAYEVLENLWGYQDSPAWVYLSFGLPLAALSVAPIAGIVCLLRLGRSEQAPRKRLKP